MVESKVRSFPPEVELLLCCARTSMGPDKTQKVRRLVQEGLDWPFLLETASRNGVLALLFRNLNTTAPEAIPQPFMGRLRKFFHFNSVRNQFLAKELIDLLHHFEDQGIRAIPFKGPALAAVAFNDLSLREFGDLDILVQKRHLPKAYEVLMSSGYVQKRENSGPEETGPDERDFHIFIRGKGIAQVRVDLQWVIKQGRFSFRIDREEFFDRSAEVSLAGTLVRCLRAEDLLLILCVHGSKHLWDKLKWICDVAELIQVHEHTMDWKLVMEQAEQLGARRMLELGLDLSEYLIGTGASGKALKNVKVTDQIVHAMTLQLSEGIFREVKSQPLGFERSAFYLGLRDRSFDRIRYYLYLCINTPPSHDWNLLPHPLLFALLYYLILPFRLAGKYGLRSQRAKKAIYRWLETMG